MINHKEGAAEGILQLAVRQVAARTVLHDCYFRVPLQVMRPFYLDDTGTAYLYLITPCGGVVGGDCYTLQMTLQAGARLCVSTPSATKIYATRGPIARQRLEVFLEAGAVFEYLPEQTIPFANSAFHQETLLHLGAGACAIWLDLVAPGRQGRGERFQYHEYSSEVQVRDHQGKLCLRERLRLQPQQHSLQALFEQYAYLGTFYAIAEGRHLPLTLAEALHQQLAESPEVLGSASILPYGGLAVRVVSTKHTPVERALYTVWDTVRQEMLGYSAVRLRK